MEMKLLSAAEVRQVFHDRLQKDFPPDEVKPVAVILNAMALGKYACYGWMQERTLLGYAFFVKTGTDYLLDYFAIHPDYRQMGYGSAFLAHMAKHFCSLSSLIAEVENPNLAESEVEAIIRRNRLQFYLRNGFRKTMAASNTFGVDYWLLELTNCGTHSKEETHRIYWEHYHAMLPDAVCRKMIHLHDAEEEVL